MFKLIILLLGLTAANPKAHPVGVLEAQPEFASMEECEAGYSPYIRDTAPNLVDDARQQGIKLVGASFQCLEKEAADAAFEQMKKMLTDATKATEGTTKRRGDDGSI